MEKSFGEKLDTIYNLSLDILYVGDRCIEQRDLSRLPEDVVDDLWGWADGLNHKYHIKRQSGQCSLQATIDYDVAAEEHKLDETIVKFRAILAQLTATLTNLQFVEELLATVVEQA